MDTQGMQLLEKQATSPPAYVQTAGTALDPKRLSYLNGSSPTQDHATSQAGKDFRHRLIEGRLSDQEKHDLMTDAELRTTLVAPPISDKLRQAIENIEPRELRPILLGTISRPRRPSNGAMRSLSSGANQHMGDAQPPAKKVLTAKRSGRPERLTDLSFRHTHKSSTANHRSSAPFPLGGIAAGLPDSPEPARIVSDLTSPNKSASLGMGHSTNVPKPSGHTERLARGMSSSSSSTSTVNNGIHAADTERKLSSNIHGPSSRDGLKRKRDLEDERSSAASPSPASLGSGASRGLFSSIRRAFSSTSAQGSPIAKSSSSSPIVNSKDAPTNRKGSLPLREGNNSIQASEPAASGRAPSDLKLDASMTAGINKPRIRDGSSDDGDFEIGNATDTDDTSNSESEVSQPSNGGPASNGHPEKILNALDGRPYTQWFEKGKILVTHGALIPSGYQKLADSYPWVCPVDTCRYKFDALKGLGGHFNARHLRTDFNDNGDGTLSMVHQYDKNGSGTLHPARIVSQNAPTHRRNPMPEPSLPLQHRNKANHDSTPLSKSISREPPKVSTEASGVNETPGSTGIQVLRPGNRVSPVTDNLVDEKGRDTWKLIRPFLPDKVEFNEPTSLTRPRYVPDLIQLPRVRELQFRKMTEHPYAWTQGQDTDAMLMQITGKLARKACLRCQDGRGPFEGCIVLSSDTPERVRDRIKSCANCFYKGNHSKCSFIDEPPQQVYEPGSDPAKASEPTKLPKSTRSRPDQAIAQTVGQTTSGVVRTFEKQSGASSLQSSGRYLTRQLRHRDEPSLGRPNQYERPTNATTDVPSPTKNPIDLPVEEWEVAPGRIRDEATQRNIAFSTAYLTHGEVVSIRQGVSSHLLKVRPGTHYQFKAAVDEVRQCFVVAGKPKVKMVGQEFEIGPCGMFWIESGATCFVQNRYYQDVTLYVTAMPGEF